MTSNLNAGCHLPQTAGTGQNDLGDTSIESSVGEGKTPWYDEAGCG